MTVHHYTIKEVAEILQVKERAIQRRCKRAGLEKQGNKYLIPKHILDQWTEGKPYTQPEHEPSMYGLGLHKQEDGTIMQVFSQDEYETFKRMLVEHKQLKERVNQLEDWKQTFLHYAQGRNILSAHDKGLLNHENEKTEDVEPIERMVIEKRTQKLSDKELRSLTPSEKMDFYKWINYLSGDA